MRERAVSEVVGYILILGIFTIFIAFSYAYVLPSIENQKEDVRFENAKNTMIEITESINEVSILSFSNLSHSKSLNFQSPFPVLVYSDSRIEISAGSLEREIPLKTIVYESRKGTVGYENTGCFVAYPSASLPLLSPRISFLQDTSGNISVYIPVVKLNISESSFYGKVILKGSLEEFSINDSSELYLEIESGHFPEAWERCLREELSRISASYEIGRDGNTVELTLSGNLRIFLSIYSVEII
ncbi:MAG: hypothetical protein H5T47_03755 [Archaeoglobi archaeon]|nr:hypothetical protein [Candidatus Mnemosynella bozhongmuii]